MRYTRLRKSRHAAGFHRGTLKQTSMRRDRSRFRNKGFRKGYNRTGGFYGRFAGAGAELKFHDIRVDLPSVPDAGLITDSINKIVQGVKESERIGRKVTLRSINWRFNIELQSTTDKNKVNHSVRVILFLDKQCNGATAAVNDILEFADWQSFNNLANKSRFRTLMDRTYDLNAMMEASSGTPTSGRIMIHDSCFKKINIPIEFDNTTGAITEIRSNNIGVLLIGSNKGDSDFTSRLRLRYSDS